MGEKFHDPLCLVVKNGSNCIAALHCGKGVREPSDVYDGANNANNGGIVPDAKIPDTNVPASGNTR